MSARGSSKALPAPPAHPFTAPLAVPPQEERDKPSAEAEEKLRETRRKNRERVRRFRERKRQQRQQELDERVGGVFPRGVFRLVQQKFLPFLASPAAPGSAPGSGRLAWNEDHYELHVKGCAIDVGDPPFTLVFPDFVATPLAPGSTTTSAQAQPNSAASSPGGSASSAQQTPASANNNTNNNALLPLRSFSYDAGLAWADAAPGWHSVRGHLQLTPTECVDGGGHIVYRGAFVFLIAEDGAEAANTPGLQFDMEFWAFRE